MVFRGVEKRVGRGLGLTIFVGRWLGVCFRGEFSYLSLIFGIVVFIGILMDSFFKVIKRIRNGI